MRLRLILFLFVSFITVTIRAQYETMMLNDWLNQLNMESYRQQQQMGEQLMGILNQESERQKKTATVVCLILPGESPDTFFAHVSLVYLNSDELELIRELPDGTKKSLSPSSYFTCMGTIITPSVFGPNMTFLIRNKNTGKIVSEKCIPSSGTAEYSDFVEKAQFCAKMLINTNSSSNNMSGSYSGRTYDQITYDIEKAYKHLGEMKTNKRRLKDDSVLHSTYDRMIQKEEQRIQELRGEFQQMERR